MGYDQYAVRGTVAVESLLLLFFSIYKYTSMASRAIYSNFFEEQWTQNYSQYLSGLSRALHRTTFLEITVYKWAARYLKSGVGKRDVKEPSERLRKVSPWEYE